MSFYEDKVLIANMNKKGIYLFKNRDNKINMEYYNQKEGHRSISICKDAYEEFDLAIENEKINLIYQDRNNYLKLLSINGFNIDEINLPKEKLSKVYEIKLNISSGIKNIFYLIPKFSEKGVFEIYHYISIDGKWKKSKVEDLMISKFLNPIKVLNDKDSILLFFYYKNQICLKVFDIDSLKWKETIKLTDNSEKLYIDVIKDERYIHLAYSKYVDQNLSIKYKKYTYKDGSLIEVKDKTVSNKGNTTHPTLILENDKIWVAWKDSLGLKSSFSKDEGETFSNIYLWKMSKASKYIRYDYRENENNASFKLNSSFGTIYPYISFIGFGELKDVEEITRENR
ncbi:MAG: hypothetical protein ACTHW2_03005 [Tissierella sp.]|uniref:hypothetical protein n=1 Tax=Tissierella sp. TaxID=41274 RepID=UPI003F96BCCD